MQHNLYEGRFLPNGQKEIVNAVRMADLGSEQEIFIRGIGGAIIKIEGALAEVIKNDAMMPFGMVNSQFGPTPVKRDSVILFDPYDDQNVVNVVDEEFFERMYSPHKKDVVEEKRDEKVGFSELLTKLAGGETLTEEELARIVEENNSRKNS